MVRYITHRPKITTSAGCVLAYIGNNDAQGTVRRDYSGYNNTGTLTGATWTSLPSGWNVNSFDGIDDRIAVAHNASLNLGDNGSLECWIKNTNKTKFREIFLKVTDDNSDPYPFMLRINTSGQLNGQLQTVAFVTDQITGGTDITNAWKHVVFEWSSGGLELYVNGVADAVTVAKTIACITNGVELSIGGKGSLDRWVVGNIALTRIYNVKIPASVIASHFQNERYLFGV